MVLVTSYRALFIVFGVFIAGSIYRALHFYITGFYVPDEWGYAYVHLGDIDYQSRPFFQAANLFLLPHDASNLVFFMPFYFMFWLSIGLLSAYGTMKLLYDDPTVTKTLLLSLTLPVFLLFTVTILTEPVAFAVTMLGIYATVWFWKKGTGNLHYVAPTIAAFLFSAANLTRADFIVFQVLGWVPFLVVEAKRTRNVLKIAVIVALFLIPAVFFLFWPYDSGGAVISSGQIALNGGQPLGPPAPGQAPPPVWQTFGHSVDNGARLFIKGLIIGWNPVFLVLLTIGFFYTLYKRDFLTFWLGLLSIGTFAGTSFVYSYAVLPLSTDLRYSYDALPAFFLLIPPVLAKMNNRKAYGIILLGLVISGAAAATSYQTFFQSNLGANYPYLDGRQSFVTLDYRTPFAQMRDYFRTLPPYLEGFHPPILVVGEPQKGYYNMSYNWKFTPGVSDLNMVFLPYSQTQWRCYFFYLEPPNFDLKPIRAQVIFDTSSFYLAIVGCPPF